ncbi:MAG: lytic transglycosylase domain-containing protein [Deltaproteobacteria bacterium]|nr:lytic transglycosylase domain-containing protein [Deltaproteobacteria bacterium]
MVRALARASLWLCMALPSVALAAGVVGHLATRASQGVEPAVEIGLVGPDLIQIDQVLAHRAPELGLDLRRRVAEAIVDESRKARFDPMLVLGLIETESAFVGDAVSIAGARGLMQLMPVTLDYVAQLEGVRLTSEEIYRDPAMQVRLAVRYLSRLEKRFRSLDLGLMAYNGGPERLRQALEEGEAENWFGNYVRTVRMNQSRYRLRLSPSSLARIERPKLFDGTDVVRMP